MFRNSGIFALWNIAVIVAGGSLPSSQECGKAASALQIDQLVSSRSKRVVNGQAALPNSWPWIGAMVLMNGDGYYPSQFCGGTLISDTWFLTAAHCIADLSSGAVTNIKVMLGTNNLRDGFEQRPQATVFGIQRVITHPDYNKPVPNNNDIALLKLAKPVVFTPSITPACLPSRPANDTKAYVNFDPKNGNRPMVFVAGWGRVTPNQMRDPDVDNIAIGSGTDQLRQTSLDVYTAAECKKFWAGLHQQVTDQMVCASTPLFQDSCQGDSGGPLVRKIAQGAWEVIGIVSNSLGCQAGGILGIYSDVFALLPWLNKTISSN